MKSTSLKILAAASLFAACKPNIEGVAPTKGNADFSHYTAIGNSLTAGYSDGTLYRSGQINSFPNMLAGQFKLVGGGEFKQPLLPGESGWPGAKRVLGPVTGCDGVTSLGPMLYPGAPDTAGSSTSIANQGPFNNLGVPGIRAINYTVPGYAYGALLLGGVGYAFRMYENPAVDRPIDVAAKSNHTFFTMWLGNNDVLGYATKGGEGLIGGTNPADISPLPAFQASYKAVVDVMTAKGQKGVLINIPDVTALPLFNTIPAKGLVLARQGQADSLNAAYAPLGIKFNVGANPFVVQDAASGAPRLIKDGEYLLLTTPQDSIKCKGWGSIKPIPKQYVLDANEVANVRNATQDFNAYIRQMATEKKLAFFDVNSYFKTVESGVRYNGLTLSPVFVTGGVFSLDGVHLTPRGYALVANQIIRSINDTYGSTIPEVDVTRYNGVLYP